jgi:hypothetical protein
MDNEKKLANFVEERKKTQVAAEKRHTQLKKDSWKRKCENSKKKYQHSPLPHRPYGGRAPGRKFFTFFLPAICKSVHSGVFALVKRRP